MTRRIVEVGGQNYTFSPDDAPQLGNRSWAVIQGRVIDEITDEPPRTQPSLTTTYHGLSPRSAQGGLIGLVGIPANVFPALNRRNYTVPLTIRAAGYLPFRQEVTVRADANFLANFTPTRLGDLALHREPVVIQGRTVVAGNNTTTPVSARIRITGIWRTAPPAHLMVPSEPPNLVSLDPPLYTNWTVATGRLRRRNLTPITGNDKFLMADTAIGANPIHLSNRQNLSPGDILLIDANNPDLAEYLTIQGIVGASTVSQPAQITLDYAPVHSHRRGALVQKLNPQALGAQKQLTQAALAGDTCLFLNNITGLAAAREVQLSAGPPQQPEYHRCQLFEVTSNAEGYFRFPPLHRVAQVEIQANITPPLPPPPIPVAPSITFSLDYTSRENRLDIIFRGP